MHTDSEKKAPCGHDLCAEFLGGQPHGHLTIGSLQQNTPSHAPRHSTPTLLPSSPSHTRSHRNRASPIPYLCQELTQSQSHLYVGSDAPSCHDHAPPLGWPRPTLPPDTAIMATPHPRQTPPPEWSHPHDTSQAPPAITRGLLRSSLPVRAPALGCTTSLGNSRWSPPLRRHWARPPRTQEGHESR